MGHRVIVTGVPCSLYDVLAERLSLQHGIGPVFWSGQRQDVYRFEEHAKRQENLEIQFIHESILAQTNKTWFTDKAPRWYNIPYPGPKEYLAQFEKGALLVGKEFCLFLDIWVGLVDYIVVAERALNVCVDRLYALMQYKVSLDECEQVVHHYHERLEQSLAGRAVLRFHAEQIQKPHFRMREGACDERTG